MENRKIDDNNSDRSRSPSPADRGRRSKRQKLDESSSLSLNNENNDFAFGTEWESTFLKKQLATMSTRLSQTEATVTQNHKLRKQTEELFEKEKNILEVQVQVDKETIKQLQKDLETSMRRTHEERQAKVAVEAELTQMKIRMEKITELLKVTSKTREEFELQRIELEKARLTIELLGSEKCTCVMRKTVKYNLQKKSEAKGKAQDDGPIIIDVESEGEIKTEKVDKKEKQDLIVEDEKRKTGRVKLTFDMIRRNLFGDGENTDDKSTKSSPRRGSDPQKSEDGDSVESKQQNEATRECPGILESVSLVPTKKSLKDTKLDPVAHNCFEISVVYDQTQRKKKQRRKSRSSDLEWRGRVEDRSGQLVWKTVIASPYEELFNLTPSRKEWLSAPKPQTSKEKPAPVVAIERREKLQLKNSRNKIQYK